MSYESTGVLAWVCVYPAAGFEEVGRRRRLFLCHTKQAARKTYSLCGSNLKPTAQTDSRTGGQQAADGGIIR